MLFMCHLLLFTYNPDFFLNIRRPCLTWCRSFACPFSGGDHISFRIFSSLASFSPTCFSIRVCQLRSSETLCSKTFSFHFVILLWLDSFTRLYWRNASSNSPENCSVLVWTKLKYLRKIFCKNFRYIYWNVLEKTTSWVWLTSMGRYPVSSVLWLLFGVKARKLSTWLWLAVRVQHELSITYEHTP